MREKKYANVLEDKNEKKGPNKKRTKRETKEIQEIEVEDVEEVEEEEKEEKVDDKKNDLSKTREFKFKELQEVIDCQDESPTQEIVVEKKDKVLKKETKIKANELDFKSEMEEDLEKTISDDLYITRSFKPLKFSGRLKKGVKFLIGLVIFCAVLFAIGYFFVYPLLLKYKLLTPNNVFEKGINTISSSVNEWLDYYNIDINNYKIDANYSYNFDNEDSYLNSKYKYNMIIGKNGNNWQRKISVKDNDNYLDLDVMKYNSKYYLSSNLDENNFIKDSIDNDDIINLDKHSYSTSDLKRYFNVYIEALKSILNEDALINESDELLVNGTTVNVSRYSFEVNKELNINFYKKYVELISGDKDLLAIGALLEGYDESYYQEYINELQDEKMYDHEFLKVYNIYLVDGDKFVGFDIEEDGFRNYYYYNYNDSFEIYLNLSDKSCVEKCDDKRKVFGVSGKKVNDISNVEVKYNNKKVMDLVVRKFEKEKIDLDYKFSYNKDDFEGTLNIVKSGEIFNVNLTNKMFRNGKIISLDLDAKVSSSFKIIIDETQYIKYNKKKYDTFNESIINKVNEIGYSKKAIELFEKYFVL